MSREQIDLAAIRARVEAATPGPWRSARNVKKCLDALTVKNRRRQGFKGKVYRCTICRGAGHNAQTCARREAA